MKNKELWLCCDRAMSNLAYQNQTADYGKQFLITRIKGSDVIGSGLKAPLTSFDVIFVWPMFSVSMTKGTGVVTSVPSDAPDDYAVLFELNKKKELRKKFDLSDDQVLPFQPLPII